MTRLIFILPFIAACGPLPDDYTGDVVSYNGSSVQIEAAWDGTSSFTPTPAIMAKATEVCGSPARFLSGTSADRDLGGWPLTIFTFKCGG